MAGAKKASYMSSPYPHRPAAAKTLYLNDAAELVALMLIAEGTENDLKKASGFWPVSVEASDPHNWKLNVAGTQYEVPASMVRLVLRNKGFQVP